MGGVGGEYCSEGIKEIAPGLSELQLEATTGGAGAGTAYLGTIERRLEDCTLSVVGVKVFLDLVVCS